MYPSRFLASLINLSIGLASLILSLRFILKLFGANQGAPFVSWIYAMSSSLLDPFRGIFPTQVIENQYVLEFSILFAILIYALIGYLLTEFIGWIDARSSTRYERVTKVMK